jgi:glucosamine 6-phosphate synthetase-like amidotransferase/phosphosugar isomerase protein
MMQKRLNDAKKANQMNENYYLKKLKATQNYINASNEKKKTIEEFDEENASNHKMTCSSDSISDNR